MEGKNKGINYGKVQNDDDDFEVKQESLRDGKGGVFDKLPLLEGS